MKLFTTGTSPFVRKVLVALRELGLDGSVEKVFLRPSPTETSATLSAHNPLNKIPALLLDDGTALYDSPVICEYLETLSAGRSLIPKSGPSRFDVLRRQALCDGILDAGILVFYELHQRPKELHWPAWIEGQSAKARQGLDQLEREVASFGAELDLGQILRRGDLRLAGVPEATRRRPRGPAAPHGVVRRLPQAAVARGDRAGVAHLPGGHSTGCGGGGLQPECWQGSGAEK